MCMLVVHLSRSDRGSIDTLVKKVGKIQELIKIVIEQAKGVKVNFDATKRK